MRFASACLVAFLFALAACTVTSSSGDGAGAGAGGPPGACTKKSCADVSAECGSVDDGCGGANDCGACTAPLACGGAGVANKCAVCTKSTDIDPENCGACGRSCKGASCVSGRCLTTKVVPIPPPVVATTAWLFVDDTRIYGHILDFNDVGRSNIWSAPKAGAAPTPLLTGVDALKATFGAQDGASLFFGSERVLTLPKTGGSATPFSDPASRIGPIVAANGFVYWSDIAGLCKRSSSASGAGCDVLLPADSDAAMLGELSFSDLATDGVNVYFTHALGGKAIESVPVGGGAAKQVAPIGSTDSIRSITADGKNVYFLTENAIGGGAANRAPIGGGAVTVLGGAAGGGNIVVDARYVYWGSGKALSAAPIGGGDAIELGECALVGQDKDFVYCADDSFGIVKLAKL